MRLKKLWIDGFKNLNNFEIDFESRDGITVLIGNNASGKSNILEAISAIFSSVYTDNTGKILFDFKLKCEIKEKNITISKIKKEITQGYDGADGKFIDLKRLHYHGSVTGKMRAGDRLGKPYDFRPSQVIALYSGEELRLWKNYYEQPYFQFNNKSLKSDTNLSDFKMLYINKYHWDIALLTMYASDMDAEGSIEKIIKGQLKTIKLEINIVGSTAFLMDKHPTHHKRTKSHF